MLLLFLSFCLSLSFFILSCSPREHVKWLTAGPTARCEPQNDGAKCWERGTTSSTCESVWEREGRLAPSYRAGFKLVYSFLLCSPCFSFSLWVFSKALSFNLNHCASSLRRYSDQTAGHRLDPFCQAHPIKRNQREGWRHRVWETESRDVRQQVGRRSVVNRKDAKQMRGPEWTLTKSEALVVWLLLVLLLRVVTVDCGEVSLLTAVVATSAVAHPATQHRSEDNLDAVQVGSKVGPWKTNTHSGENEKKRQKRQKRQAGDELHPSSFSLTVTHSPSGQREVYKCARVCADGWPVARCSWVSDVPQARK